MARMIHQQQIGFVVANGDVAGARRILMEAKANPELLRAMGQKATRYLHEHLSLAQAAQGYFDLICLESNKTRHASSNFGTARVKPITREKMKCAVIFGGTGYVGTNWARWLARKAEFQRIILADVRLPASPLDSGIEFCLCDVRKPIDLQLKSLKPDWIFNFAAVHREPGHRPAEYFDTNLPGANNVCAFAEGTGCSNILFTSSISVYGPTHGATTECSPTHPTTPYGVSKLCAELIHEKWLQGNHGRRLIICRPGVIYGPGDPGNILRMIRAVQRGYFFFPGPTNIRKSYGYIEGLLESFEFAMARSEGCLRFNYVEERTETIGELVKIIRQELGCSAPVISCPLWILQPLAKGLQFVSHGRSPIHPARVRKAATPTHIVPQRLEELGFQFRFDFRSSLDDWQARAPQDFGLPKPAPQPASWIGAT
jgi:nucleoside-diphosphate-sugar epimerase